MPERTGSRRSPVDAEPEFQFRSESRPSISVRLARHPGSGCRYRQALKAVHGLLRGTLEVFHTGAPPGHDASLLKDATANRLPTHDPMRSPPLQAGISTTVASCVRSLRADQVLRKHRVRPDASKCKSNHGNFGIALTIFRVNPHNQSALSGRAAPRRHG